LQNLYAGVRFSPAPPFFSCSALKSLWLLCSQLRSQFRGEGRDGKRWKRSKAPGFRTHGLVQGAPLDEGPVSCAPPRRRGPGFGSGPAGWTARSTGPGNRVALPVRADLASGIYSDVRLGRDQAGRVRHGVFCARRPDALGLPGAEGQVGRLRREETVALPSRGEASHALAGEVD